MHPAPDDRALRPADYFWLALLSAALALPAFVSGRGLTTHEATHCLNVREMFEGAPRESIVYLNHPVRFDTRRADELLAAHGLRCPRFDEYAANVVRFFREHESDPALRPAK